MNSKQKLGGKPAESSSFLKNKFFNLKTFLASILVLSFAYLIVVFNKSITSSIEGKLFFSTNSAHNKQPDSEMAEGGDDWKNAKSIYEFKAPDINGNMVELEKYK